MYQKKCQVLRLKCPYCNKWNPTSISAKLFVLNLLNDLLQNKSRVCCHTGNIRPTLLRENTSPPTFLKVRYHVMHSHVLHKDSSSKSCSKLTPLVTRSFSLAVISTFAFGLIRGLRLITMVDVDAAIFRFLAECRNPFGVCRKCLAIW